MVHENIGRAWFAIDKLRPIFISKISDANKMRLFKATDETIAAYGLESVPMTRSLCRQIDASHRQMVRAALGITRPETSSTAELTQRAKLIPLIIIIITMGIYKCYFSGNHIALSKKNYKNNIKKQHRCEHRITKNQQIKSTVHGAS